LLQLSQRLQLAIYLIVIFLAALT